MPRRDSRSPRRLVFGALAASLASLPLSGCGAYTKQDFSASANAICAGAVRSTRAVAPPDPSAGSDGQRIRALGRYLEHVVPIVRTEAKQIDRLPRPQQSARERKALRRYLVALSASVSELESVADAAARGSAGELARAENRLAANPVAALATAYGLASCGPPPAT